MLIENRSSLGNLHDFSEYVNAFSSNMITNAKKRHIHERLSFEQVAFEDMTVLNGEIDFISSSLAFHYIADFQLLIKKISTALCEGGILLFSLEHPMKKGIYFILQ